MTTQTERCDETVSPEGSWHSHKCGRPLHAEGKCKIHCPEAVAARRAKSQALWDAKRAASPYATIERLKALNAELLAALERAEVRCLTFAQNAPVAAAFSAEIQEVADLCHAAIAKSKGA